MGNVYEMQDNALGMLLRDFKRYWPIAKTIGFTPEAFIEKDRIKIASMIKKLADNESPVTYSTIIDAMSGECAGFISLLPIHAPLGQNFQWFMEQINSWYSIKNLVLDLNSVCNEIIKSSISESTEHVIKKIKNISEKTENLKSNISSTKNIEECLDSTFERLEQRIIDSKNGVKAGYKTGITNLDTNISGLVGGRFYIIAARTSVGKTTFALSLCLEAMKQKAKPLFFSNEMDKEDLIEKMISSLSKINSIKFQNGDLDDSEQTKLVESINFMRNLSLNVDEKSGWDLDQLLDCVHRKHRAGQCDIVFVDYLQQVRVRGSEYKQEQVSIVSDAMKKLSRDLKIPVIGLAQINRESEKNQNTDMPKLSNLKDSGSLEQDADVVMILHKKELSDAKIDLGICKNRHGMTGVINLTHILKYNCYEQVK